MLWYFLILTGSWPLRLFLKPVSLSADSEDMFGRLWILLELLPQPCDMHVYCALGNEWLLLPHVFKNVFARDRLAAMINKVTQQFRLLGRQAYRRAVFGKLHFCEVRRDTAEFNPHHGRQLFLVNAAQQCSDARQQFIGIERFDQVIVGAGAQSLDAVGNLTLGGEHQDGPVEPALAHSVTDFEAIEAWQHNVKNN